MYTSQFLCLQVHDFIQFTLELHVCQHEACLCNAYFVLGATGQKVICSLDPETVYPSITCPNHRMDSVDEALR